jgi:hypothetical protein
LITEPGLPLCVWRGGVSTADPRIANGSGQRYFEAAAIHFSVRCTARALSRLDLKVSAGHSLVADQKPLVRTRRCTRQVAIGRLRSFRYYRGARGEGPFPLRILSRTAPDASSSLEQEPLASSSGKNRLHREVDVRECVDSSPFGGKPGQWHPRPTRRGRDAPFPFAAAAGKEPSGCNPVGQLDTQFRGELFRSGPGFSCGLTPSLSPSPRMSNTARRSDEKVRLLP